MKSYASPVGIIRKDIYIIKNDINTKVYIGQALDSEKRFKSHCKGNYDNSLIDKAIQKYGKQHFWYEILEAQVENYNEREQYWIKYYNSKNPHGYNILNGGQNPPLYRGNEHPNTKISEEKVIKLKKDLAETQIPLSQLANKYQISKKQVLRINQGISQGINQNKLDLIKKKLVKGKGIAQIGQIAEHGKTSLVRRRAQPRSSLT